MPAGTLFVVATPIGNLEDVTLRALRVLGEVDVIAAEDTRRTRILLAHHGIRRPLVSYYDAVERERAPQLVARLVAGESVALVSDAGTPGIADPGYRLVCAATEAGVPVVPVPGPSAVAAIVSVCGLPAERFCFEGFLPARSAGRRRRLEALAGEPRAMVFLESGRRLHAFLDAAAATFGARRAVVGREMSKRFEEFLRGTLPDLAARLAASEEVRGEVTVVIAGAADAPAVRAAEPADLDARLAAALAAGASVRDASAHVAAEHGLPRREVYRRALVVAAARSSLHRPRPPR